MILPAIKINNKYKKNIVLFGGLNKMPAAQEGEFSECSGISHINKPYIGVRQKQNAYIKCEEPDGIYFGKETYVARGEKLYCGEKCIGGLTKGKKHILEHNGFVLVFPDKKYYDIKNGKFGKMDASYTVTGAAFKDGKLTSPEKKYVTKQEEKSESVLPEDFLLCYENVSTSTGEAVVSGYSKKQPKDVTPGTIYKNGCLPNEYKITDSIVQGEDGVWLLKIRLITVINEYDGLFSDFRPGDYVQIENCLKEENNGIFEIESISKSEITFSDKTFTEATESGSVTISRKIPDFSSVCLYENRLWGISENIIYASALGDPFNYYTFKGLSTDSFTVTSNTAQPFTACIAYTNSCMFFKEDGTYKLFGSRPSNFQLIKSFGGGVESDASDSIVATASSVMYKGIGGVYSCFGGVPVCISKKLGAMKMKNACAGSDERRYYIAFDDESGKRRLFVYDIDGALWSVYGETDITAFIHSGGALYTIRKDGIYTFSDEPDKDALWSITLQPLNEGYYGKKAYCRLKLNVKMTKNSYISAEISCDGKPFEGAGVFYSDRERYFSVPLGAKKCSEITIRLSGRGDVLLRGIEREFNVG